MSNIKEGELAILVVASSAKRCIALMKDLIFEVEIKKPVKLFGKVNVVCIIIRFNYNLFRELVFKIISQVKWNESNKM